MLRTAIALMLCMLCLCAAAQVLADTADPQTPAKDVATAAPSEPGKPYTALIIDASGFSVERCMSPKIKRVDSTEVWGTVKVDPDFVEDHGIVGYATSMEDAKRNPRCGLNPMVVKAMGRAGGNFRSDPIVSDADAKLILEENAKGKFLDNFNVIFIKDGKL